MKRVLHLWPSFLIAAITILFWHGLISLEIIPSYLIASPKQVLETYVFLTNDYVTAVSSTLTSALIGFVLSSLLGFLCALILASSQFLKRAFLPFSIFFQTVPIIAIAPLLVIWFGFGEPTVRVSAFIVSFFPVLANSIQGLNSVDPGLIELFRAYGASKRKMLWSLQIPSSLSSVFAGLQVSAGLAVIGAIVGEFIAGGGLGGMIDSARTQQRVDIVLGAILLSSLMGILFVSFVRVGFQFLLRWRPFFHQQ
ncbi:MAG: ABC transporter permease [Pseudobdellovibrionaceae bacterium]